MRPGASVAAGTAAAVFDTRIEHGVIGGAARPVARRLHRLGYRVVTEPMSFAVDGIAGPLGEGRRGCGADRPPALPSSRGPLLSGVPT